MQEELTDATKLTKDEWDSVFYSDLFSRPDVETSYCENTLDYDQGRDRFTYNSTKEYAFFGDLKKKLETYQDHEWAGSAGASIVGFGGGSASASGKDIESMKKEFENLTSLAKKDVLSTDKLNEWLKQKGKNVQWTGQKFTPKGLSLHRLNTNKLQARGRISYRKCQIVQVPITIQNKIHVDYTSGNSTPSQDIYQELKNLRNHTNTLFHIMDERLNHTVTLLVALDERLDSNVSKIFDLLLKQKEEVVKLIQNSETSLLANVSKEFVNLTDEISFRNWIQADTKANYLTKQDYEKSMGVLPHEFKYSYDSLLRHRICRICVLLYDAHNEKYLFGLFNCSEFYIREYEPWGFHWKALHDW